ncbi:MAG TPA: bifunctional metallophosphatase/5'-nucleotidase, partial [Bacteroidaceae bacterium]|nr:bifunctional metallophosphatase/5'-nucleotidase [Bacteroidaceae bacterium]
AVTAGNHDIEAGPEVYNKIRKELEFPLMAANALEKETGLPYFEPYTVLKAGSYKIAVLGLITPGIPNWLPENLWYGLEFNDMAATAKEWVPVIEKKVRPDLLIGLFHSGVDYTYGGATYDSEKNENASIIVAREIPGFDVIFAGHDHRITRQWECNSAGDSVLIIDPGSHGRFIGEVLIKLPGKKGKPPAIEGRIIPVSKYSPTAEFMEHFEEELDKVKKYVSQPITYLSETIYGVDALFGPAPITSLVHRVQMQISNAEISFTSPLSYNFNLSEGSLLVSDMYKLYRFENLLYTMELTGREIDRFLEYSASLWFNSMKDPSDHLLLFDDNSTGRLKNQYYNFSSAAGIEYTVDVSKPVGERVHISKFTGGRNFFPDETYTVAMNSHRGSGGGGHLTTGAGIPKAELKNRLVWSSEMDLRYLIIREIMKLDTLHPFTFENWKIVPEQFHTSGKMRDKPLLLD